MFLFSGFTVSGNTIICSQSKITDCVSYIPDLTIQWFVYNSLFNIEECLVDPTIIYHLSCKCIDILTQLLITKKQHKTINENYTIINKLSYLGSNLVSTFKYTEMTVDSIMTI